MYKTLFLLQENYGAMHSIILIKSMPGAMLRQFCPRKRVLSTYPGKKVVPPSL